MPNLMSKNDILKVARESKHFKAGVHEFKKSHGLLNVDAKIDDEMNNANMPNILAEMRSVSSFEYYSKVVPNTIWNNYYSKIPGYTFLDQTDAGVRMGFLSMIQPQDCLMITNDDDLIKIKRHRESINMSPR
jgi:hypothetical protein